MVLSNMSVLFKKIYFFEYIPSIQDYGYTWQCIYPRWLGPIKYLMLKLLRKDTRIEFW